MISIVPVTGVCLLENNETDTFLAPQAFKAGIFNSLLTKKNLFFYISTAILQSLASFLLSLLFFSSISNTGKTENGLLMDIAIYIVLSISCTISIFIEAYSPRIKTLLVCLLSVIINIVIIIPLGYYDSELLGFNQIFVDFSNIWIFIIPIIVFNSLLAYFSKVIRFFFYPDVLDKIQRDLRSPSLDHKSRLSEYKKNLEGVYKESPESKNTKNYDSSKLSTKTLKFSSKYLEKFYQQDKITENHKSIRILLLIGALSLVLFSIQDFVNSYNNYYLMIYLVSSIIFFAICSFVPLLPIFSEYPLICLLVYYVALQVFFLFTQIVFSRYSLSMMVFIPILGIIGFSNF